MLGRIISRLFRKKISLRLPLENKKQLELIELQAYYDEAKKLSKERGMIRAREDYNMI